MNPAVSADGCRRRAVTTLDGWWDFAYLGPVDPDAVDHQAIDFDAVQPVPGCFDVAGPQAGGRGLGAYRCRFTSEVTAHHRIVFAAVNHWCRVIVDGRVVRDHVGGFTRFDADLPHLEAGEHELVVLVDNRDDPERTPTHRDYYDWYHWGGIPRPVALHCLGELWIERAVPVTEQLEPPVVAVTVHWAATAPPAGERPLRVMLGGSVVADEPVVLAGTSGSFTVRSEVPGAALWSPAAPTLHDLVVELGDDALRLRTGLRQVSCDDGRLCVNGEAVRLAGVSRHEFHPDHGSALPPRVIADDVALLRDLGCTFVRGGHYPQDERFLDLCDAAGICVWVEATGWQNDATQLTDERFLAATEQTIDEMVAASAHHPSVILWGLLNESRSDDPACRPGYERLVGRIRSGDPTRPVTYASNHIGTDRMLDLVDVVSVNEYVGWYHGDIADIPGRYDEILAAVDAAGAGGKPVIFSELGAEGLPGWRDPHGDRWSEEHQARLLDTALRHLLETRREQVAGALVWVFSDFRVSPAMPRMLIRAGAYNHKGVVDRYRRPKLATEVVRRWCRDATGGAGG